MTNPYAVYLGGRDAAAVIRETPARLAKALHAIGPERALMPVAEGKWSPKQILCHLADTELAFAFRLRQARAQDHHVIQPFDQDSWAESYAGAYDAESALRVFTVTREWNLALIASFKEDELAKAVVHPERGEMTLRTIVETMAGHDENHLRQMEGAGI